MDNKELNKNLHTSGVVGARIFENPWPVTTAYQQLDSQRPNPLVTPGRLMFTSCMDNPPASPQEKPSAGIGITRFAGGTFFPPGPQKSYYRKNSSLGFQNNSIKPYLTTTVSDRSPGTSREPSRSTAIRPNFFEQWRTKQVRTVNTDNGGLGSTEIQDDTDEDLSDEDGGVTLASSLAIFMQGPGETKLPLRQMANKSDTHQNHEIEYQEPKLEEPKPQVGIAKKTVPRFMDSQMAILLQTPGVLSFGSHRPNIHVPPVNCPTPTNYPIYHPGMALERGVEGEGGHEDESEDEGEDEDEDEEDEEEKEEEEGEGEDDKDDENIYERKARSAYVETPRIFDESGDTTNSLTPSVDKYEDVDTSRYWRSPGTSFVYLRSTSTPSTTPPTILQKLSRPHKPERSERPERRAFRHLKDGDIVGDEAFELPKANKGRLMMEKMGYKEGTALGTNEERGLIEPVKVEVRLGKRGLGLPRQELVLPTQASASQVNLNQMILPQMAPARVNGEESTYAIARQFQQMDIIAFQQAIKYSLATPLSTCQTRLRLVQILAQLDASELLNIVAYNHILSMSMDRVAEQQSRQGFLVDSDLMQIITGEYNMAVLRADQNSGGNYSKMNKFSYW